MLGSPTEAQRLQQTTAVYRAIMKSVGFNLRVAIPGVIQSFNKTNQTVVVSPAITENLVINQKLTTGVHIPDLLDVPVVLPRTQEWALTFPINQGDECLVVFADVCINYWWKRSGIQNQEKLRRHNLSDGFAILAPASEPIAKSLMNYNTDGPQLRNTAGTVFLGLDTDGLTLSGVPVAATYANISMSLPVKIAGVKYYIKLSTTP
jgi:hypothetical protein